MTVAAPSKTPKITDRTPEGWIDRPLGVVADQILETAVHLITGREDTSPRPGQVRMIADMTQAMAKPEGDGQAIMEAPTGSGKSATYLAAAAASWVTSGRRSVVSTESLALQAQITDKDAPIIVDATDAVAGMRPKVAVLKGWANYVCAISATTGAEELLQELGRTGDDNPVKARKKLEKAKQSARGKSRIASDRSFKERFELVDWALEQATGNAGTGDKNTYPNSMSDPGMWESVSVSSSDCIGADRCSFADVCLPKAARQEVVEADIVVTNHSLIGVQAANDIPVVIGSNKLGQFDHIFIDEAHGLPTVVRNQGSVEVSGRAVRSLKRTMERVLDRTTAVEKILETADVLASLVDEDLAEHAKAARPGGVVRLHGEDNPLPNAQGALEDWLKLTGGVLKKASEVAPESIPIRRALGRCESIKESLDLVTSDKHGGARWTEMVRPHSRAANQTPYPVARFTPVDVSAALRYSIYSRPMTEDEEIEAGFSNELPAEVKRQINAGEIVEDTSPEGPKPRIPLSVVALSATLPSGFPREMGMRAAAVPYSSPFDTAYGDSVLFVPRAVDAEDVAALESNRYGRAKFDTNLHRTWATKHIIDLVEANGGSALVLAATAAAGKEYAQALAHHAKDRWDVKSQWGGQALRRQVAAWKEDESSVLVGTRSLFTGVDASGPTCSLVIIDRPPRAAGNPVDDARVEQLINEAQMDKWTADRFVYVSDAALMMEQGAGRLIRAVSDSGMVAVLDPRLLKNGPFSYQEPTRKMYLDALRRFDYKISHSSAALEWLREKSVSED